MKMELAEEAKYHPSCLPKGDIVMLMYVKTAVELPRESGLEQLVITLKRHHLCAKSTFTAI